MNRLEGRFAAGQITGGREYQEDDYGLIEGGGIAARTRVDQRRGFTPVAVPRRPLAPPQ